MRHVIMTLQASKEIQFCQAVQCKGNLIDLPFVQTIKDKPIGRVVSVASEFFQNTSASEFLRCENDKLICHQDLQNILD